MKYKNLTPFKWCIIQNFPFIEADFDAITNYQLFCKVVEYLNKVIDNTNIFGKELEKISNYFDTLDVQEEINKKLDNMVETGELQEIITSYINLKSILCYNNINEMKEADNLVEGSFAKTMGYYNANDGGQAFYKIRKVNNQDIVDNALIIALNNENLIAELCIQDRTINVNSCGILQTNEDNSLLLQTLINNINNGITLLFPNNGIYTCKSEINLENKQQIRILGQRTNRYNTKDISKLYFPNSNGFVNCKDTHFYALSIEGNKTGTGITGTSMNIEECNIAYFENGINGRGIFSNNEIHGNIIGIIGAVDSRIINNTINANTGKGIELFKGCNDNVITNNKIEWNEDAGIGLYINTHNIISNNIFDRNNNAGIAMTSCNYNNISDNVFRRNGANPSSNDQNSNILIRGCKQCIISNNNTVVSNTQDDGSGNNAPLYSIYIDTSDDMLLIGNNFKGGTNANPIRRTNNGLNLKFFDLENPTEIFKNLDLQKTINTNTSETYNLNLNLPIDNSVPNYNRLIIKYRGTNENIYGLKEVFVYTYEQYSSIKVKLSDTTIIDNVEMSIEYSQENGFVLTITNNSTNSLQIKVESFIL